MGSEGGRNGQGIVEAFLETGMGLSSRQSLDIVYRDDGEGIPGKGSRRSKGPETAVRGRCSAVTRELLLGPHGRCQVMEVGQEK